MRIGGDFWIFSSGVLLLVAGSSSLFAKVLYMLLRATAFFVLHLLDFFSFVTYSLPRVVVKAFCFIFAGDRAHYSISVLGNRLALMSLIWRSIISICWEHRCLWGLCGIQLSSLCVGEKFGNLFKYARLVCICGSSCINIGCPLLSNPARFPCLYIFIFIFHLYCFYHFTIIAKNSHFD